MTSKHKNLVIIGAGGHGKVCGEIAKLMKLWDEILFLDDAYPNKTRILEFDIIDKCSNFIKYIQDVDFFIAIGDNSKRRELMVDISNKGGNIITLIHPNASISSYSQIEFGSVIMSNTIVGVSVHIKSGVIINTAASIDHDCFIANYCHISPKATICGTVKIDELSWIGAGATVINDINICKNVIIGAGSLVVKDINSCGSFYGHPVKSI